MRVSPVATVGAKNKKKGKKRPETVGVVVNAEPDVRKRKKRKDKTTYKNPARALKMVEKYPGQMLKEKDGLLWCEACNKNISFAKGSDTKQHLFGVQKTGEKAEVVFQAKPEEKKLKLRHYRNVVAARAAVEEKNAVERATELFREEIWKKSREKESMKGSSLPVAAMADRVEVLKVLLEEGIPVTKLASSKLIDLIEKPHQSLGGINGVRSAQPILREMVMKSAKTAVAGRPVGITFDGSKVNFSIEGMLARVLNDDFMPVSVCIGAQALKTSLDAATMRGLIKKHLDEAGIGVGQVVAFCSDSGPPNPTAMKAWNVEADELYFGAELSANQVQWLPCLMHAFSNAGNELRKALVGVKKFMSGFKTMVNESPAACETWTRVTGQACPGMSEKTFWSWYRRSMTVLDVWDRIPAFLAEAKRRTLAKKSIVKMAEAWASKTLKAELLFCQAFGKALHDASFELEGDGFCIAFVQKHVSLVSILHGQVKHEGMGFRMFTDAVETARAGGLPVAGVGAFVARLQDAAERTLSHFDRAVLSVMKDVLPLYEAAGLFEPQRFTVVWSKPEFAARRSGILDLLAGLKGVGAGVRAGLDAELLLYEIEERNRLNEIRASPSLDTPSQLWMWWRGLRLKLPNFFAVAAILVLMQPSSAAIERFFATVKANTSAQQNGEAAETLALRAMCLYNS
jgi:hypothetical protein